MAPQKGFFTASLILAEITGFSALSSDDLLGCFFEEFHPKFRQLISNYTPISSNSWGNAIFCAFNDPVSAAHCALDMRDFFQSYIWDDSALPRLNLRISLHASRAFEEGSPDSDAHGFMGARIDLAAGLEPMLKPGEVWTSDIFIRILQTVGLDDIATDKIGVKPIARKWGGNEIHRLRRSIEAPLTDKNIYEREETKRVDPIAILINLYQRGDDEQQINAVKMLGKKDDPRAVEKLCSIAQKGSLSLQLRLDAIASLGEQQDSGAVPTLASILDAYKNEDPRIQIACVDAIIAIGDLRGGRALLHVLKNMNEYQEAVVLRTVESLAVIRHKTALNYLNEQVRENRLDEQVLIAVLHVLITVGDLTAAPFVVQFLDRDIPLDIRCAALTYLAYGRPQIIKTALQELALDRDGPSELRVLALAGLTKIDSNETKKTLAEIAEAAESLSSYAAQFLVEGKDYVEKLVRELRQDFIKKL